MSRNVIILIVVLVLLVVAGGLISALLAWSVAPTAGPSVQRGAEQVGLLAQTYVAPMR